MSVNVGIRVFWALLMHRVSNQNARLAHDHNLPYALMDQPWNQWRRQSNHGPTTEWTNHGARPQNLRKLSLNIRLCGGTGAPPPRNGGEYLRICKNRISKFE